MSRIIQEADNELLIAKISMLESNISRVRSQNRKLQALLESSQQFDRLREFVSTVQHNWARVSVFTQNISHISEQIKLNQKAFHTNANQCNQYISNNILSEMHKMRIKMREYQLRMDETKGRFKLRARKELQVLKSRVKKDLVSRTEECIKIVQICENSLLKQFQDNFIPPIVTCLIEQFADKNQQCRIELGHIHNLVLYRNHQSDGKIGELQIQKQTQQNEYEQMGIIMSNLIEDSCGRMNQTLQSMELKLKKVNSDVCWIKNQIRLKKKTVNNDSVTVTDHPGSLILSEIKEELEDTKNNSLGLGKYCDRLLLLRRIIRSEMAKSQREHLQRKESELLESSKWKMLSVRERITKLSCKMQELSLFYSQF